MPSEIINLLIQLPIVAVFIWYSDRKDKQFIEFLNDQRAADHEILVRLLDELKLIGGKQDTHDNRTAEAIARMEERTAKRRPA